MVLIRAVLTASARRLQCWVRGDRCERRRDTGCSFRTHISQISGTGRKRYAIFCGKILCLIGIKVRNPLLEDENRFGELLLDDLLMCAGLKLVSVSILLLARHPSEYTGRATWVARIALYFLLSTTCTRFMAPSQSTNGLPLGWLARLFPLAGRRGWRDG